MSKACDFHKIRQILLELDSGISQQGSDRELAQLCGLYANGNCVTCIGGSTYSHLLSLTDAGYQILDTLREENSVEQLEQYAQSQGITLTLSNLIITSINAKAAFQQLAAAKAPAPMPERKIVKTFCGHCQKETRCVEVWNGEKRYDDEVCDMWLHRSITITQCLGCDEYTVAKTEYSSENRDYDGEYLPDVNILFPPQAQPQDDSKDDNLISSLHAKVNEHHEWFPERAFTILHESITARTNHLDLLSMVGLRMAIDACCQDAKKNQVITKAKREEFLNNGMLSKKQHSMLEQIVNSANEAVHQFTRYSDKDFSTCFEGVLTCMDSVYYTEYLSKKMPEANNNRRQ